MKDTYLYKVVNGELTSELFDSDDLPKGWHDSPDAAKKATSKAKKTTKAVKDDDSSGTDK